METQEGTLTSSNHAWLSLDLLEVLCRLAELGHADQVREILEFPRNHCPELLALGLVQVNTDVSFKVSHSFIFKKFCPLLLVYSLLHSSMSSFAPTTLHPLRLGKVFSTIS